MSKILLIENLESSLIFQQLWYVANKKDVLWMKWAHEYHTKGRNVILMDVSAKVVSSGNENVYIMWISLYYA